MVVVGNAPDADAQEVVDGIHRAGRHARLNVLTGVQGEKLMVILGGTDDPVRATRSLMTPTTLRRSSRTTKSWSR